MPPGSLPSHPALPFEPPADGGVVAAGLVVVVVVVTFAEIELAEAAVGAALFDVLLPHAAMISSGTIAAAVVFFAFIGNPPKV